MAGITADLLTRFALSCDITPVIFGCRTPDEVRTLAEAGRQQASLTSAEKKEIVKPFVPLAERFAFYRGSVLKKP